MNGHDVVAKGREFEEAYKNLIRQLGYGVVSEDRTEDILVRQVSKPYAKPPHAPSTNYVLFSIKPKSTKKGVEDLCRKSREEGSRRGTDVGKVLIAYQQFIREKHFRHALNHYGVYIWDTPRLYMYGLVAYRLSTQLFCMSELDPEVIDILSLPTYDRSAKKILIYDYIFFDKFYDLVTLQEAATYLDKALSNIAELKGAFNATTQRRFSLPARLEPNFCIWCYTREENLLRNLRSQFQGTSIEVVDAKLIPIASFGLSNRS